MKNTNQTIRAAFGKLLFEQSSSIFSLLSACGGGTSDTRKRQIIADIAGIIKIVQRMLRAKNRRV